MKIFISIAALVASIPFLAGPVSGASAAVALGPPLTSSVGESPTAVATGDLDRDGSPDLVSANFTGNTVSVALNRGDGSFAQSVSYPAGTSPRAVEVIDLDRDGLLDVAVANANSNNVSVKFGTGSGSLGPALNFAVGARPFSVAGGDLNRDGIPDLVTANSSSNTVSVLIGQGGGSFAAETPQNVGELPFAVLIVDLDGDGRQDLATANAGGAGSVSTLFGRGDGTFGPTSSLPVGTGPFDLSASDFNRDGFLDLATADSGSGKVSVLLGEGGGEFGEAVSFPAGTSPYGLTTADFSGDRIPDIAVADFATGQVSILVGDGLGGFGAPAGFPAGTGPFAVASSDLDGDRARDLVIPLFNGSAVAALPNSPLLTVSTSSVSFQSGRAVPLQTLSSPRGLTLANTGSAPLRIRGFTFSGSASRDFLVDSDDCRGSIRPGGSCTVTLRFAPLATGSRSARLSVISNAASILTVTLSGKAVAFPVPKVICKTNGRAGRRLKITCRASWPSNTLSSKAGWTLSRGSVIVRRGSVLTDPGRRSILPVETRVLMPGGRYVLRVEGVRAATFKIPRR